MRPALLLVDVQHDFLGRVGLFPDAQTLEEALQKPLAAARERDWPVIHIRTRVRRDGSDAMPHWSARNEILCAEGTPGAEPPQSLKAREGELLFVKQFYSPFDNPGLVPALKAREIDTLLIAGLHTHACVRTAAVDAYARGLRVFVVTDAVASYDCGHAAVTLDWLHDRVAQCWTWEAILSRLEGTACVRER